MTEEIKSNQFIQITPAGAFFATVCPEPDSARAFLLQLLSADVPIPYTPLLISKLTGLSKEEAEAMFQKLLDRGFAELKPTPPEMINDNLESVLPTLLPDLSSAGKVVLADDLGFCLASSGYEESHSEELAALAADISSLHGRHNSLLNGDLSLMGESWGLLDPVGLSQVGFWMLYLGKQRFVLVIEKMPRLNQQVYVDLLSILARRYLNY
ncbi:hypothetical protein [Neptuniibacter sp. CAU 1671]|uniref:hypothetical protein n=1 Tax=Neptuniibacter sp. CAU 1671 TaxID=3032593 RepID=UPI0023DACB6F|nr:hypothetical protein [Neptuniibacter sp. CAU 1671]MDF2180791.1 hypothetical protein [Neptuniibacter sp. CAU 1671]